MFNRRVVLGAVVVAGAMLANQAVYASPLSGERTPVIAKSVKEKMVKFSVRNDSKTTMSVKAGDTVLTIEPGKTVAVKLAVGTALVAQADGRVLATVSTALDSATIAVQ